MKRISLLITLLISLFSCQVTERFYLYEDGSVLEEKEIDLSAVLGMMDSEQTASEIENLSIDTIVDATADLKSILPADSKETLDSSEEILKEMDKSKLHIILNKEQYKIKVMTEADNIQELNAYNEKLSTIKSKIDEDKDDAKTVIDPLKFTIYTYDDHGFKRSAIGGPLISQQQEVDSTGLGQGMADAFLSDYNNLMYHGFN